MKFTPVFFGGTLIWDYSLLEPGNFSSANATKCYFKIEHKFNQGAKAITGTHSIRMSFWGTVAAAASSEQGGAAAAYTCPSKARLWNSIIESLLGKREANIAGEGGKRRAPNKLSLQERLKVLRQSLAVAEHPNLGSVL